MEEQLSTVEIGKRLTRLHNEFPDLEKLNGLWLSNFGNANTDVSHTIRRSDSDIHRHLLLDVYMEVLPFEQIENFTYWDMDSLTPYGLMLAKVRYCLGYAGNMQEGQVITREQALALIFAYEAYWHFGEDFTLGNNVEFLLRRLLPENSWGWPSDKDFKYQEERRQYQWLARAIVLEMKTVARYHRLMAPGMENIRTADVPKPDFRDFRALHDQIKAKAKADSIEKKANRSQISI